MILRVLFFLKGLPSQFSVQAREVTFVFAIVTVLSVHETVDLVMTVATFSTFELDVEGILVN